MAEAKKPDDHLEIHALPEGGYVVREGRYSGGDELDQYGGRFRARWERAAFSNLADALAWMGQRMKNQPPILELPKT